MPSCGRQPTWEILRRIRQDELAGAGGQCPIIHDPTQWKLVCQFRPGDSDATFSAREFDLVLPSKVKIGLTASNISAKPFTATFENFAVLTDVSVIDEQFGESKKKVSAPS